MPMKTAGSWRLASAGLLLLGLAACASPPDEPLTDSTYREDREMFMSGYDEIEAFYIEPVDVGALAMVGLQRLSAIDPRLSVRRQGTTIVLLADGRLPRHRGRAILPGATIRLLADGRVRASFEAPARDDAAGWGILTADVLNAARSSSSILRHTSNEDLYEAVFKGVLSHLDGVSRYASAREAFRNRISREGFGGIGIRIAVADGTVRVISVMHYTPAAQAGLRADDRITRIDGRPLRNLDQNAVVDLLRGPVGSRVDLRLVRAGESRSRDITVTRGHIVPETVVYEREGNAAYLRVYSFNLETAQSLRKEVLHAQADIGAALQGYILDLRGNPGGLLDQAVAVADLFLDHGPIVSTHGRHPDSHQYFEASGGDYGNGEPIIVLVNGNSASAAEIVAAALQDSGRAVVIGSNSYGKGTVQTVLRMPNQGELTLTWARFHAPSGYTLNHLGVLPSICTNSNGMDAAHLIRALRGGDLVPVPTVLRNTTSPHDQPGLDRLRAACPIRKVEEPIDIKVAHALLNYPRLYSRALHLADPPNITVSTGPALTQAQP